MERELFDRDTLLDLVVNFIPLGILLFFVGVYLLRQPWGFDLGDSGLMLAVLVVPFVALALLTYVSAVAIAGDEQDKPRYAQGQAGLKGATPIHEDETETTETEVESEATETKDETETAGDEPSESETDEEAVEHDDTDAVDEGTAEATGEETADDDH